MSKKKEELLEHQERYHAILSQAKTAIEQRCFRRAVELAVSAWAHVDGMMQYERKYEQREFESVECVDIVLRYSPVLLDLEHLDQLECLLKKQRRVEKNTTDNLKERVDQARTRLHNAYRLLGHLEIHPNCDVKSLDKALGNGIKLWEALVTQLEEVGIVRRHQDSEGARVRLVTSLDDPVLAKCMNCGQVVRATKAAFFTQQKCPSCQQTVHFVLLRNEPALETGESL